MFRFFRGLADRALVLCGALLFAQAPQFYGAYTQRLAGHADELRYQVQQLAELGLKSGRTLDQYIAKFVGHSDAEIASQGLYMLKLHERMEHFTEAYTAMVNSTAVTRPFTFLTHLKWDVAQATVQDFHFGVVFTMESAAYALLGMGLGYACFCALGSVCNGLWRLAGRARMALFRSGS